MTVGDGAATIVNVQLTRGEGFPWNVVSDNPMYGVITSELQVLSIL